VLWIEENLKPWMSILGLEETISRLEQLDYNNMDIKMMRTF